MPYALSASPPFKPLAKALFAWARVHAKCSFVSLQLLWWISSTLHLLMTEVPTHTLHKCRWAGSNWGTPSAVVPRTGSWPSQCINSCNQQFCTLFLSYITCP